MVKTLPKHYRKTKREGVMLSSDAVAVLEKLTAMAVLGIPQVYLWQGDDGPHDYALLESLVEYLGTGIGWVARITTYDIQYVTMETIGSGSFIVCLS